MVYILKSMEKVDTVRKTDIEVLWKEEEWHEQKEIIVSNVSEEHNNL